jgi:hypothetical protein
VQSTLGGCRVSTAKSPGAVAAHGALEIDQLGSEVTFSPTLEGKSPQVFCAKLSDDTVRQVDPRLVFLLRAAARFELVEAGELCVDEAFDGLMSALYWEAGHE